MSRDEQILSLRPKAKRLANAIAPDYLRADAYGAAMLGAIQAVDRWDESRNCKLATFAEFRMRGAILDLLRAETLTGAQRHAEDCQMVPLSIERESDKHNPQQIGADTWLAEDPRAAMDRAIEAHERLARMPAKVRSIVEAHFFGGASQREIAAREGVNESRISQRIHAALRGVRILKRAA